MENLHEESNGNFLHFGYYEHFFLKEEFQSKPYEPEEEEIFYEEYEYDEDEDYEED